MTGPDDSRSPWERDDWLPEPAHFAPTSGGVASPTTDSPPPGASSTAAGGPPPSGSTNAPARPQVLIAAAFGVVLLVAGAIAVFGTDEPSSDPTATVTAPTPADDASPNVPATPVTVPIAVDADGEITSVTAPPEEIGGAESELARGAAELPVTAAGERPIWRDSALDVPPRLAAMEVPTEVVALTDEGVLHRVEFPSGRVRTISLGAAGVAGQVVVADDAIVVYSSRLLTVIRDDAPIEQIEIADGVIFVQEWPGTDRFIVTTAASSATSPEQQFVLDGNGTLAPLDDGAFDDYVFWARSFLPSGEVVVNRAGGVYAIAPDQTVRRLSDGDLLATGRRHYAVEECDAALSCIQVVVDAATGERVLASLASLAGNGFVDPSTRLSPDGRSVVATDTSRGTGVRQILDVGTGAAIDLGRVDLIFYADTWAADSSGLFSDQAGLLRFHPREPGDVAVVDELGRIASIGARAVGG